jgi:hypothetical protein
MLGFTVMSTPPAVALSKSAVEAPSGINTLPDEDSVRFSSFRLVLEAVPKVLSNLIPFVKAEMGGGIAKPCQKFFQNQWK